MKGHISGIKGSVRVAPSLPAEQKGNFTLVYTPHFQSAVTSEQIDFTPQIAEKPRFPPLHGEMNHGNVSSKWKEN